MEILHALRGLTVNARSSTTTMSHKSNSKNADEETEEKEEESDVGDRKRNRLKSLPPKSPKKTATVKPNKKAGSSKTLSSNSSLNEENSNKSQSLGGYYKQNEKEKSSTSELPLSRKSSLSSLTSLIQMSPRLFPRFSSKHNRKRSNTNGKSNTSLSPHRENACTNEFYPVDTGSSLFYPADSSRTSSRCVSPAPSECRSLPAGRCQSPDRLSLNSTSRIPPISSGFRPELYLDPNQDLSAVRRLMSSDFTPSRSRRSTVKTSTAATIPTNLTSTGYLLTPNCSPRLEICPVCRMPFDKGKKRKLVDSSCGHERCYACMFRNDACPICNATGSSPPKLQKSTSGSRLTGLSPVQRTPSLSTRTATPSWALRTRASSPGSPFTNQSSPRTDTGQKGYGRVCRSPWTGAKSQFSEAQKATQEKINSDAIESSHCRTDRALRSGSTDPSSQHSHESGFQSATSLNSLEQNFSGQNCEKIIEPKSFCSSSSSSSSRTFEDPFKKNRSKVNHQEENGMDECVGLDSSNNHCLENDRNAANHLQLSDDNSSTRRHSLSSTLVRRSERSITGGDSNLGSRRSIFRRSTKLTPNPSVITSNQGDDSLQTANTGFRQPYWTLKPLFFEVPNSEPLLGAGSDSFVGRQWLFREIYDHLSSDLPTNRGVIVTGTPGTGKTGIILKLVKHSCFGRGESMYQELPTTSNMCSSPPMSSTTTDGASVAPESIYGQSQISFGASGSNPSSGGTGTPYPRRGQTRQPVSQVSSNKVLSSQVVAYHFCQSDNAPTCLVPEFVHSIAAQMSQSPKLTPYYHLICSDVGLQNLLSLPGCVADPSRAFVQGILEPLNGLRRLGKLGNGSLASETCLLVIDGLCAAEIHRPDHGDTIATFISKHLLKFPHWLKIVCTVRTDMLEITKLLPFQKISLDKTDVDERLNKDMTDYLTFRIRKSSTIQTNITPTMIKLDATPPETRFTQFMVQASKGCFLYTKMILDLIERGHLVVKSSTSFNVLPLTLSQTFLLEFNLKFSSSKSFEKVHDLLSVAISSLTPLTPVELFHSVNALVSDPADHMQWGEFLMRFSALSGFLARRADDTLMFFHPIFREWLIRRESAGAQKGSKFLCDPRLGHAAISFRMCRMEAPLSPDRTLELGHHILKAHVYKNMASGQQSATPAIPARDLQAMWIAMASEDVSLALGAVRNVASPNVKVSRLLLLAGASPDYLSDYFDEAPLIGVFANQGYIDMISLLIEFGADVNASNASGVTPIMFAARQGHLEIVRLLIQHGGIINLVDKSETSALVYATQGGHLNVVSHLLSCDWTTDAVNDLGLGEAAQQAMVAAAQGGHDQILEYLLDMSEVNVNHPDTLTGETALCAAANAGQKTCCEIALRRGAKVSAANLKEIPSLHMAISGGHWAITDILLKEGASLEQTDTEGKTPLMVAAMEGHVGVLELLISRQAKMESTDSQGLTALSWACLKGQAQAANCLLEHQKGGADINHADKSGRTPLDLAAHHGNPDLVQLLLDKGANMEHVDLQGMRPLDRAISSGNGQAVQCFLKKGAKLGPTTWAMANDKPDIMLILLNKLLEDGNTLYRRNRFEDAAHRYQYAVKRLPPMSQQAGQQMGRQLSQQEEQLFDQLRIHLLLNLSRSKRKMGDLAGSADTAGQVLQFRPDCLEALHARARANREAGKFKLAIADLTEALKISPQNRDVHKNIIKVKEEMKKQKEEEENNNNSRPEMTRYGYPVGASNCDEIKFVDDSASELSHRSNN